MTEHSVKLINIIRLVIQEIERNTKFNVLPKLCHIWSNSQALGAPLLHQAMKCRSHFIAWQRSSAPKACDLSQIWHNFGRTLNLVFLSISWIFILSATSATYLSEKHSVRQYWPIFAKWKQEVYTKPSQCDTVNSRLSATIRTRQILADDRGWRVIERGSESRAIDLRNPFRWFWW